MKTKILFLITLVLMFTQGLTAAVNSNEMLINPEDLSFNASVGELMTQTIRINFADAEIPPDPNTPVVMSIGNGDLSQVTTQISDDYSLSIMGGASNMFSAAITMTSITSNSCVVQVFYTPTTEGTHQATLKVYCSTAGVPQVTVNLTGSTSVSSENPSFPSSPYSDKPSNWNGVERIDDNILSNLFDHDGFDGSNGQHNKRGAGIVKVIIEAINEHAPKMHIYEVDENNPFNDVTVGTSATKEFEVWGHNLVSFTEFIIANEKICKKLMGLTGMVLPKGSLSMKIKIYLTPIPLEASTNSNFDSAVESDMFTVNPNIVRPCEIDIDEDAGRKPLTVTYKPTAPGTHLFRFGVMFDFYFYGIHLPDWLTLVPIQFVPGLIEYTGTAEERIITASRTFLDFSTVVKNDTSSKSFTVRGTNLAGDLTLTTTNPKYKVSPSTISAEDAAKGTSVTVTYNPTVEGTDTATLKISGGKAIEVPIRLSGKCVANQTLTASTAELDMGSTNVGTPLTGTFTIIGENLTEAITLVEPWAETIGGEFSINPTVLPKTGGTVTVTYTPSDAHTSGAAFKFKSGNLVVNVAVIAMGISVPRITTNKTLLDFETVAKNSNNTKKFTVRGYNLTGDLTISPERSSYFTISPTSITAAQAQSANGVEVTVTYKPTAAGNHSATFTISSDGAADKQINVSGKCASLTASTTELDMGSTYVGTPLTGTFTITGENLTEAITLVEPWAETLDGNEFSISPKVLPKIGGTVTVTYTPSDAHTSGAAFKFKSGNFVVNVAVTAKGLAVPRITTTKTSLDFGTIALGKDSIQTFKVYGYDLTSDLTVSSSNSSNFKVSPTTISKANAAKGVTVTVTYKPTSASNHSGKIIIGNEETSKSVSVSGKCASLTASPTELNMDPVYVGEQGTATFKITGVNLTEAITLVQPWAETIGGEFSISPTTLPKTGGTVTVTYKPSDAHTSGAAFKFKSGNFVVNVAVTAKGISVPRITTTKTSLDFETVAKNSNNPETFTVRGYNLTGDLTISPKSSSYFTISPTTITAAQAQSANGVVVTVTYKPEARGSHSATFTISGGGAANKTVNVSGKCAEITTSTSSLRFASNYSQKFTVKGYYLTSNLTLSSNNAVFTVTPSSITPSQAASGVEVTVKCNAASNLQHTTGKITIKGGNAATKTVSLSYDYSGAEPQAGLVEPEDEENKDNDVFSNVDLQEAIGNPMTEVNELSMSSKIYANGQNIVIESPVEQNAMISDMAGRARSVSLQTGLNEIPVNASGIYIVRIREKTTKLIIK